MFWVCSQKGIILLHPPVLVRYTVLLVIPVLLVVGLSIVAAQQLTQADGRINQVAHFGGDAIYCVDGNKNVTHDLPTSDPKGFRLLNKDGQELWYVPGHDFEAAIQQAIIGGEGVLIAVGNGSYGPTALYTYNIGGENGIFFVFTGYDEHGKSNSLTFQSCIVGPAVAAATTQLPTASLAPSSSATTGPTSTPTNTPTDGPTATPSDTPTNTNTATPSDTPTNTSTPTPSDTPTNTNTPTPTDTPTDEPT